jgi:hypothetical protein
MVGFVTFANACGVVTIALGGFEGTDIVAVSGKTCQGPGSGEDGGMQHG